MEFVQSSMFLLVALVLWTLANASPAVPLDDDDYLLVQDSYNKPQRVLAPPRFQVAQQSERLETAETRSAPRGDLEASATGHGHGHGHGGYDTSGYLDMGAYTGAKGAFGWYADYPVRGGH